MKKQLLLILIFSFHLSSLYSSIQVVNTTCEYMSNPLGVSGPYPRLSWQLYSDFNDVSQTAFEILVSSSEDLLNKNIGDCWTSGKVYSSDNIHIYYRGSELLPFKRYYWKVRVYDKQDQSSKWSNTAWFETAMLSEYDWKAKWISDGSKQFNRDEEFYEDDRMPLFRKDFLITKKVESARLYICGLGYYEAYMNGKRIGDNMLDPGWTSYSKEILYVTYDVTSLIKKNANVVGVMLGNGWYNPLPLKLFGRYNLRDYQETGRPILRAQLLLCYKDGSRDVISTNTDWLTAKGPIVRNNVYLGEKMDARLEVKNWNTTNNNKNDWKNAVVEKGPRGKLIPQMQPAVKIKELIKPSKIWLTKSNTWMVDMGVNFAGVAKIRVKGKRGLQLTLRYGENIHADSTLNWYTTTPGHIKSMWNIKGGPGAPENAIQEDSYILKGSGMEEYMPRFTFHGFRYIEVFNYPGKLSKEDIIGVRMCADVETNGNFICSNESFNELHAISKRTFLSNLFSVQSDCPGREKMGYGGDIVATSESFIYNFNMANFYRKTARDFFNDQTAEGGITEIAPFTGIVDRGIGGNSGPLGWQLAFPYVQKQLYEFYGDKEIIEDCYPAFVKQVEFIIGRADGGLFHWDIGDHNALDPRAEAFSASAFYYAHLSLIAEFAKILDKKEDLEKYSSLADNVRKLIIKKYYVPSTGRIDNGTQAAQAMALYYNLTPDYKATLDWLLKEYKRHNYHISTGIFACKMGFDVLRLNNLNDIAYSLVDNKDYPGWLYMISQGATTLWESWEYPENGSSQNHPMFGSTEEWFYRSILGINSSKPGFKEVVIKPQPVKGLLWAKGDYESIRGRIVSDWSIEENDYRLKVEIPVNTTALVYVKSKDENIIHKDVNAKYVGYEDGYAIYKVPSGRYTFITKISGD